MKTFQLAGQRGRLDRVLVDLMEGTSRSTIQKWIKDQHVTLNGQIVKANYKVQGNEFIQVSIPQEESFDIEAENIPLDIRYEDEDLLVINKPAGMVVHPSKGHTQGTLVNALMYYLGDNLSHKDDPIRPGIVHRLDKDTSGLLLVAKNNQTHQALSDQFANQLVDRYYQALVAGVIEVETGAIEIPLARDKKNRLRWSGDEKGKYALTLFEVIERFDQATWVQLELKTGRTHQIRVHMEYIGHPIIGDPIYRQGMAKVGQPYKQIDNGQYLHCGRIIFTHPKSGERIECTSQLPDKMVTIINRMRI